MDPNQDDFYGQIPRKKKKPPPDPQSQPEPPGSPEVPIPRKKKKRQDYHTGASMEPGEQLSSSSPQIPRKRRADFPKHHPYIQLVSESPLCLRITGIGLPRRQQRIVVKQKRRYAELQDTDSDDLMSPEEEKALLERRQRKKKSAIGNNAPVVVAAPAAPIVTVDGPPPGMLPSLYYSQEMFLNLWSMEKICGWKTRPKVRLERVEPAAAPVAATGEDGVTSTETPTDTAPAPVKLEATDAIKWQQKLLTDESISTDPKHRMEVSRLVPKNCPLVMAAAASAPSSPYRLVPTTEREEVLLIKWRGRSHLHCSWERSIDIQQHDPSPNNTARGRIKRFFEKMILEKGLRWKEILEEQRAPAHRKPPTSGETSLLPNSATKADDTEVLDEYFSPQCLEVERIMGCDEGEMTMELFAKQRAINIDREQQLAEQHEGAATAKPNLTVLSIVKQVMERPELVWDPEDNVRYIVKWKGLQYNDVTWEYWRDIKRDAVDETEDFWYRQQPPDISKVQELANRPHPTIADFRKLQESPAYGVSRRPRPVAKLKDDDPDPPPVEPTDSGFRLRNYQLEGVNWLLFNWWNRRSCALCDEMGLGKTIQSAAFLQELQTQDATQIRGPFLIIAPLSLASQWLSELKSWAPDMNVILFHGSADARELLVEHEFYFTEQFVSKPVASKLKKLHVTKFHVLITTYEMVQKDVEVFRKIKWKSLIIDEAHRLKNYKSKLFEIIASVDREHCILLTGTPIANATEELWALLHFANPHDFRDRDAFLERFGEMTDAKQVQELHSQIKKYLLRREKKDVEKSLPNKEETILEVSLTPIQKTFYKAIYERNTSFLFKGAKSNNAPSLMNVMMELRKCCNHPFLVTGAEEKILNDASAKILQKIENPENSAPPVIDPAKLFEEQLVKSSGKMVLLDKLLQKLFTGGHKVLIFSQMVRLLDLLEELLRIRKYRFERLDGTTSSSARLHAVERFKNPACQRFVMLLSTRAGGLGLNLTAADIVIIFDSDWNPQNDLQAMARAHRIGQTRAVKVYRLLTAKTYEMHMFHSASLKLGLERALMSRNQETDKDSDGTKLSRKGEQEAKAKEIDELLKKGAYDVFRDEDDAEAEKFMETDIDQLLEQSSKTVTYGAGSSSAAGSGLGSFNKASFVANTESGEKDVDLDDPDFWSKAVGLEAPPEEVSDLPMLDDGVKRNRKQVQQYDPYAETAIAEQAKKDKVAMEKMLEKEEKERLREEKKQKKLKAQEDKQRKKDELDKVKRQKLAEKAAKFKQGLQPTDIMNAKVPKLGAGVPKPKKMRKSDRAKELRRAANEDPIIEKLKQAWEIPQRNRATSAVVRFGFGRFCKLRIEANLTSLPLQDLEVFVRVYVYQLALQVAVSMLERLRDEKSVTDFAELLTRWVGLGSAEEVDWLCDSLTSALQLNKEVDEARCSLRIPWILTEPTYVEDLKHGAGLRSLRRVGILARLNNIVEECLDSMLSELGHEELGKRGCGSNKLEHLDVDLKARFVSTEELVLAGGLRFGLLAQKSPATWWDRKCDAALIVGTFVHGLSNYELMRKDQTLPFAERIYSAAENDLMSVEATKCFSSMTLATRQVFDEASEARRIKEEHEVQAKIAEAKKFESEREQAAALVRKGGVDAEVVAQNMPETQVDNAFEFDGTDSHFVTLPRIHERIQKSIQSTVAVPPQSYSPSLESTKTTPNDQTDGRTSSKKHRTRSTLSMPDARILDARLILLIQAIERRSLSSSDECIEIQSSVWDENKIIGVNARMRSKVLQLFLQDATDLIMEYSGVGIGSNQCGISHRSLNDGSEYAFGSATSEIYQLAYGTDAPRYLRALCVPMNITRFAISALIYVDEKCVKKLMETEYSRYYGKAVGTAIESKEATIKNESFTGEAGEKVVETKNDEDKKPQDISPVTRDPLLLVDDLWRLNTELRAAVCLAAMLYGLPNGEKRIANTQIVAPTNMIGTPPSNDDAILFNADRLRDAVACFVGDDVLVPQAPDIVEYLESTLIPHCCKLCIEGNGPSTRNARGSHGEYETAFGITTYPEPSLPYPSPLPDPCLALQEHSIEALSYASAILRRASLIRCCVVLCSAVEHKNAIMNAVGSKEMQNLDGMPTWWRPEVHDVALLVEAGTNGLFSVLKNRADHPTFSPSSIQQFLLRSVSEHTQAPADSMMSVIEAEAEKFPTLFQLERRLASLCALASKDGNSAVKFHMIPMFDHGAWPRN